MAETPARLVALPDPAAAPSASDATANALARAIEAEDTLRAISAGEVDAFVVSDGENGRRVFTLSTADRPYRMFVENMRDGAATLSPGGLILFANRRLEQMLDCPRERIIGSPLARFLAPGATLDQDDLRGSDGTGATLELDLVDIRGARIPVSAGSSVLETEGDPLVCLTFTDLSAQKAQEREIARLGDAQADRMAELQDAQKALTEQATHDALTGLPNRALFVGLVDQAMALSRRTGRCTGVLFVDLDRFKTVNDTQGHAAGDLVLRNVSERLTAILRPMDTVARLGGDEFVVLTPEIDDHLYAADIGARIVDELARPLSGYGDVDGGRIGASVGIAVSDAGSGTAETMLHEADTAMYKAKSLGGGRAEVFDAALGREVQERSSGRAMLRSALDEDRLLLHYQPIVDVATAMVAGMEALARIAAPDGSVLVPSAFIPVAEASGLVVPLGTRALAMACREALAWQLQGSQVPVAVNLSSRQFDPGDLAGVVAATLESTGLDPSCLHLELTETAIFDLRPEVLVQLGRIRDLGVQIGLDDFGTGYASLTHLRRVPLSFVKIDRSFVQGLETQPEDQRIVAAVIDLAANLGLRSVGEGVETQAQLELLGNLGCDQAQGYLFARPLPRDGLAAVLEGRGHARAGI